MHMLQGYQCHSLEESSTSLDLGGMPMQALILDDNSFSEWAALWPLCQLPCLQRLSLAGNQLSGIQHPATGGWKHTVGEIRSP